MMWRDEYYQNVPSVAQRIVATSRSLYAQPTTPQVKRQRPLQKLLPDTPTKDIIPYSVGEEVSPPLHRKVTLKCVHLRCVSTINVTKLM